MIVYLMISLTAIIAMTCGLLYHTAASIVYRTLVIVSAFSLVLVTWASSESITGWPTTQRIADGAQVVFASAKEPAVNDAGAVFYLVVTDSGLRLHEYPYTEESANEAERVERELRGGNLVFSGTPDDLDVTDYEVTSSGDFSVVNPSEVLVK